MQLYKLDFPNGKSYIGITSKTAQERFKQHSESRKNLPVSCAVRSFGKDNIIINILSECDSWELLCLAEIEAIEKFNTFYPNGYNMTLGGDGSYGVIISYETKKKRSKARIGAKHSAEAKEKMRAAALNMTESHKRKLSIANTGKKWTDETHKKISAIRRNISIDTRNKMSNSAKKIASYEAMISKMGGKLFTGKKHSNETKEKMRLSAIGRSYSEQVILNMTMAARKSAKRGSDNKKSKKYICTSPENIEYHVHGLTQFCKENNLSVSCMCQLANGKTKNYKNWLCRHV